MRIGLGTTDRNFVTIPGSFLVPYSANFGTALGHALLLLWQFDSVDSLFFCKVLFFLLIDGYSIDIEWFRPGKDETVNNHLTVKKQGTLVVSIASAHC